ncbi:MAG: hypothetical protein NTW02_03515 [Cyanobium sp. LacPavin_0920_WC12_MAG_62_9]|nr:hypothetical protein [Cyanobium sp. LacPavin_0920_WC12_MAG_62_9]
MTSRLPASCLTARREGQGFSPALIIGGNLHQSDVLSVRPAAEVNHLEGLAVITPTSAPRAVACPDVVPSFITKGLTIACRSPNRV